MQVIPWSQQAIFPRSCDAIKNMGVDRCIAEAFFRLDHFMTHRLELLSSPVFNMH